MCTEPGMTPSRARSLSSRKSINRVSERPIRSMARLTGIVCSRISGVVNTCHLEGGIDAWINLGGPGDVLELHGVDDLDISALPVNNDDGSSFLNLTFLKDGAEVGGVTLDYRNGSMIETLRKGEGGWEIDLRPIYEYATGT